MPLIPASYCLRINSITVTVKLELKHTSSNHDQQHAPVLQLRRDRTKAETNVVRLTAYLWDGLALIGKGDMKLAKEPYVTGDNPVIADDRQGAGARVLFNDILGISQGYLSSGVAGNNVPRRTGDGKEFSEIKRESFGQVLDNNVDSDYDYFTGKQKVEGLGYAFLFRNYNAGLGKWTTSDPLDYPRWLE